MKILYLVDPQQDYLQSMVFEGFCSLLKEENIYIYPMSRRWKYGKADDWYFLPDGKKGFTNVAPYEIVRPNLPELSIEDICKNINMFKYIIFTPREYSLESLVKIKKTCSSISSKLIYIDGEDGCTFQKEIMDKFKPDFIFKREVFDNLEHKGQKVYPLPFAAFQQKLLNIDDTKKELDIFGLFGNTNSLRLKLIKKICDLNLTDKSLIGTDARGVDWGNNKPHYGKIAYEEYMKKIALSKISFSCPGHGRDTVRYWEIPVYKTLMFAINPRIKIPFPFEHKKNAIFINRDLSNLEEELKYYLSHDKEREELAEAGHKHLLKYHTCEKRVTYMLNIMEGESNANNG